MKDTLTNKRVWALMLALMMALASLPSATSVAWAAVPVRPSMEFASDDNLTTSGDRSAASVITGESINIREIMPAGLAYRPARLLFTSEEQGINIEVDTTSKNPDGTAANGTLKVHSPDNGIRRIDFTKEFNPTNPDAGGGNQKERGQVAYYIRSEYQANMNTGTVIETPLKASAGTGTAGTSGNSISGVVESVGGYIEVVGNSSITLKCLEDETGLTPPSFEITDLTGSFDRFKKADGTIDATATVNSSGTTKGENLDTPTGTRDLIVDIVGKSSSNASNPLKLRLHPADRHSKDVLIDPSNTNPDAPKKTVYDNFVKTGTTFVISFVVESSDPAIVLTVMTPQSAMEEIASTIAPSDGERDTTYLRFADGDGMNWITQNFQVLRELEKYGGKFTIDWDWVAIPKDDDPDAKPFVKEAIKVGNVQNGWSGIQIAPQDADVEGYLIPYITYIDGNNTKLPMTVTLDANKIPLNIPKKRLLIRGRGTLPHIAQTYETYGRSGNDPEGPYKGLDTQRLLGDPPGEKKMDAFRGGITGYNPQLNGPFRYDLQLYMGEDNGAADYAIVEAAGDTDYVILQTSQGAQTFAEYNSGAQIENASKDIPGTEGEATLRILAMRPPENAGEQVVNLTIKFYIRGRNGQPQENRESTKTITLRIQDSTPSQESRLSNLEIRGKDKNGNEEVIEYGFDKDKKRYVGDDIIYLPYRATSIKLTPTYMDPQANREKTTVTITDVRGNPVRKFGDSGSVQVISNESTPEIPIGEDELGQVFVITVTSPCLDPRDEYWTTYTLHVIRDHPSKDSTLAELGIYYADDGTMSNNLVKFDPSVDGDGKAKTTVYDITVPYATDMLRVKYAQNHRWAKVEVKPELEPRTQYETTKEWLKNIKQKFRDPDLVSSNPDDPADKDALVLTFTVRSEDAVENGETNNTNSTVYKVRIRREPPSHISTLKGMTVTDADDNTRTYRPTFNPEQQVYNLDIPYSVKQIKLNLSPTEENIGNIQVYQWKNGEPGNLLLDMVNGEDQSLPNQTGPLTFRPNAASPKLDVVSIVDAPASNMGYHPFFIRVIPECEEDGVGGALDHTTLYELRVLRAEPSKENRLEELQVFDQEGTEIKKDFAFHRDETEYSFRVPFETTGVSFTATVKQEGATIVIRDGTVLTTKPYEAESGVQSMVFALADAEKPKTFEIDVAPEDPKGEHKIYKVTITREPPSDDALLISLKTENTSEFKPLFVPKKTDYTAKVAEGAEGVIIIPTAHHHGATIKVDGAEVKSGSPSDLIVLIDIKQTVKVEVTAQDRKTKKVYNIEFTNENLIEKTNNADLRRLTVNYGQMTPKFQSSVTDYEVTTTEQTWSVDIIPRLSDPLATMRVLNGTRELGDYNGNYALALVDGQNDVTIEVTSPDKTLVKNYTIAVFRNEEEKLKNLTPLEAEDIDYERSGNPIIVKIDEYPRVGASVFNTLREDYPEKTIIFQGNDYSVRFDAANLTRVIPQTEIFDFRMSFSSPDEDAIYDLIEDWDANDDIVDDVVLAYFTYHGSLPGPASLNLSLGRKYGNETLYWHYYNQERDRLDYYGALRSNSKGTVAVSIDHFSTYVVSPMHRIAGSEDKNGIVDELGMISNGKDLLGAGGKLNPDTGAAEDRP